MEDKVDREELALALKLATSIDRDDRDFARLSPREAEAIAEEVGIPLDEFRTALADVRSSALGRGRWLGPSALQSVVASAPGPTTRDQAVRAIAEGQAGLPQITGASEESVPGVWRSSSRGSLLQISSSPNSTQLSAAANRAVFKATSILGTTGGGGLIGGYLGGLLTTGIMGEVSSTVAIGIAVGGVGGLAVGFATGVAVWKSSARTLQKQLYQAVDRMRGVLGDDERAEQAFDLDSETPRGGDT